MDNHHRNHRHHQQQQQQQQQAPYLTLISRAPRGDGASMSSADSTYGSGAGDSSTISATHDISRVSYHVKHLDTFAKSLEDSAGRAFPNRGRSLQRYTKVQVLLLHWMSDDLFVLPELEDLEQCMREDYSFETDIFPIPSENSHLELMLKIGAMIKDHEATDTLFIVYYGGHARIDESRQSTWCATRHSGSPWLQWSAIQTLLERSISDTLILLDCCAGAASATFPNGKSITETISASSWDAIAPDPGRYSFTNALIEVLQQWKLRMFSAAMLHAEVLARLKHPRPVTINGKHFEARSTPVHFMMTSNHKAPSIELGRIVSGNQRPPSPPVETDVTAPLPMAPMGAGRGPGEEVGTEPTVDKPHVMISLALEDNQQLDLEAWEQWLASFPALAKYVKVQGVFRSHSTLLLLSLPVMIWDLLPDDPACSFVAFIRSNNLIRTGGGNHPPEQASNVEVRDFDQASTGGRDDASFFSGTTIEPTDESSTIQTRPGAVDGARVSHYGPDRSISAVSTASPRDYLSRVMPSEANVATPRPSELGRLFQPGSSRASLRDPVPTIDSQVEEDVKRRMIINQSRSSKRAVYHHVDENVPEAPRLNPHVVARLEEYFQNDPEPNVAVTEFFASNLGVQLSDINLWFYHRHQQERMTYNLQNLSINDNPPELQAGTRMILPGHLNRLLEIYPSKVLLIDLRPPADFERSHVHRAANLRVPLSFLQHSTFEMIESAFEDAASRTSFAKWYSSKCVVFYDRVVEFTWECPTADALFEKFKQKGWAGKCFVLKGHYKEFSASYDKYIVGARTTQQAKDYIESLRNTPPVTTEHVVEAQEQYDEWLRLVENEDRVPSTNLVPSKRAERLQAINENQEVLKLEFETRFPELYKKSIQLQPPPPMAASSSWGGDKKKDTFDESQGPLVGPLSRALKKMQEAGMAASHEHPPPPGPDRKGSSYSGKMAAGGYHGDKLGVAGAETPTDEYDEIDPKDEQLRSDPGFQSAADGAGAAAAVSSSGDTQKKRQQSGFWKRIRSTRS